MAAEATERMEDAWKRFAVVDWLRWNDHQRSALLYMAGRWDEALAMCDRWIADAQARDGHATISSRAGERHAGESSWHGAQRTQPSKNPRSASIVPAPAATPNSSPRCSLSESESSGSWEVAGPSPCSTSS